MDHTDRDCVTYSLMCNRPDDPIVIAYKRGHEETCKIHQTRIEKLEAALREIVDALRHPKGGQHVYDMRNASYIARKALEGKDG